MEVLLNILNHLPIELIIALILGIVFFIYWFKKNMK